MAAAPDVTRPDEIFTPFEAVEILSGLRRVVAPNASVMTGPGTNSYLLGTGDLVAVDPGPDEAAHLAALADAADGRLAYIVVTHTHPDHSPGVARLKSLTGAVVLGFSARDGFTPDCTMGDGDEVVVDGWRLTALHTPGHASNHLCFVADATGPVGEPGGGGPRVLFSGDHIIGGVTTVIAPPDGDMADYLAGLERLASLSPPIGVIAPGHGPLLFEPAKVFARYLEHRLERECDVVRVLRANPGVRAEDLVDEIYLGRLGKLRPMAVRSVWAHLRKLEAEGRATTGDPDDIEAPWTLCG